MLDAQDEVASAICLDSAWRDLFSACNSYRWAVEYGLLPAQEHKQRHSGRPLPAARSLKGRRMEHDSMDCKLSVLLCGALTLALAGCQRR